MAARLVGKSTSSPGREAKADVKLRSVPVEIAEPDKPASNDAELGGKSSSSKSSRRPHKRQLSAHVAMEDAVLARIDAFLKLAETKIESLELLSAAMDEQVARAQTIIQNMKSDVLLAGRRRADAFVKWLDQHNISDAGTPISDRVTSGVEYFEGLVTSIEASHAAHSIQRALAKAKERLLNLDEMPHDWQHNPYILRGYKFCKGPAECLTSVLHLHNETCNIWTHLGGFFVLLGLAFFHLPTTVAWKESSWTDRLPMLVFLAAALKCLMCSAVWHAFCNISHLPVKKRMACVDYMGITALITGSILTTEYSVLYCHPVARNVYMAITGISGILGVLFTWTPRFDTDEAKIERVAFFVTLALAGAFAGMHACLYIPATLVLNYYIPVLKSLLMYAFGIVFYAFNIPERWVPGSVFDYFGMSHNLWHLCVFGGIYYHYVATVAAFETMSPVPCA